VAERTTHTDHNGIERTPNEWGFNSFLTAVGAERSARYLGRRGSHWFIWKLADGTYDFTSSASPNLPGHPAELVKEFDVEHAQSRR